MKKYNYTLGEITGYDKVTLETLPHILEWAREQSEIVNDQKAAIDIVKDECKEFMRENGINESLDELGFPIAVLKESERDNFDRKMFMADHRDLYDYYTVKEKMYTMTFKKQPDVYKRDN